MRKVRENEESYEKNEENLRKHEEGYEAKNEVEKIQVCRYAKFPITFLTFL